MSLQPWLQSDLAAATGHALVHSLWQAALLAILCRAVLATVDPRQAALRYGVAVVALAGMVVAPVVTALVLYASPVAIAAPADLQAAAPAATAPPWSAWSAWPAWPAWSAWPAWTAMVWCACVCILGLRLTVCMFRTQRLRHADVFPVPAAVEALLRELCEQLGVRRKVRMLGSVRVSVPMVIGWLAPVILVPVTALTGLDPHQVRAILAHELAHIRRHDVFVNLLQALVETLLFFNPAVWWVSRMIRVEREHCCDDDAVRACGNTLIYVTALTELESARRSSAPTAVALDGASLIDRVHRLVSLPRTGRHGGRGTGHRIWRLARSRTLGLGLLLILGSVSFLGPFEPVRGEPTGRAAAGRDAAGRDAAGRAAAGREAAGREAAVGEAMNRRTPAATRNIFSLDDLGYVFRVDAPLTTREHHRVTQRDAGTVFMLIPGETLVVDGEPMRSRRSLAQARQVVIRDSEQRPFWRFERQPDGSVYGELIPGGRSSPGVSVTVAFHKTRRKSQPLTTQGKSR